MDQLSNIGVIKDIMRRYGFAFSKTLGQNFLINPSVCPRMAELGGATAGVGVIEIGAGFGVLTRELCARAEKVVCIEIDSRLLPVLAETLGDADNLEIINEDVMKVDMPALIAEKFAGMQVVVCANLPYYITSPIIMGLLEQQLPIKSITVMVQKEAAARICAKPGTRECGAITIGVQYYSEPRILFGVSRGSFMPAPDVDSAVIRLDIRNTPPVQIPDEDRFFQIVRAAFSTRRKTILNCLAGGLSLPKAQVSAMLEDAGVSPSSRAEQLMLEDFASIARCLCKTNGEDARMPL